MWQMTPKYDLQSEWLDPTILQWGHRPGINGFVKMTLRWFRRGCDTLSKSWLQLWYRRLNMWRQWEKQVLHLALTHGTSRHQHERLRGAIQPSGVENITDIFWYRFWNESNQLTAVNGHRSLIAASSISKRTAGLVSSLVRSISFLMGRQERWGLNSAF